MFSLAIDDLIVTHLMEALLARLAGTFMLRRD